MYHPVFWCVDLYTRDSSTTFSKPLLPRISSISSIPTEVLGLFITVTPCNCRHHGHVSSQVITSALNSRSAAWVLTQGKSGGKEESKQARKKWKERKGEHLFGYYLHHKCFEEELDADSPFQLEIPTASSTSPGSHFILVSPTVHPGAAPTALGQGWTSRSHEHL